MPDPLESYEVTVDGPLVVLTVSCPGQPDRVFSMQWDVARDLGEYLKNSGLSARYNLERADKGEGNVDG